MIQGNATQTPWLYAARAIRSSGKRMRNPTSGLLRPYKDNNTWSRTSRASDLSSCEIQMKRVLVSSHVPTHYNSLHVSVNKQRDLYDETCCNSSRPRRTWLTHQ